MTASSRRLIVGLGNPGPNYQHTRHNIGFTFVDRLAASAPFNLENKLNAFVCAVQRYGHDCLLLKPNTWMNLSGDAVQKVCHFYKLAPCDILVVHDELDLPAGTARWKQGGGHGGHNGLRDIIQKLGSPEFLRLRLGIGHPGQGQDVSHYVLSQATQAELTLYETMMQRVTESLPDVLAGEIGRAMQALHDKG